MLILLVWTSDRKIFLFRQIFWSNGISKLIYKNKKLSYTLARQSIISRLNLVAKDLNLDLNLGLHSMRSGGATVVANSDINERCWKRHGSWRSNSSKDGYVVDSVGSNKTYRFIDIMFYS